MIVKSLPKLFITLVLIGALSAVTSCARQQETGEPAGGAAPEDQQRQTCPTGNETGQPVQTEQRPMEGQGY